MKRIYYELKAQTLISVVTIAGTALAIFLIMVVVMLQQVKMEGFGPEPDRDRTIYALRWMEKRLDSSGTTSSSMGMRGSHELFDGMEGIERIAIYDRASSAVPVGIKGGIMKKARVRSTDAGYWEVFAHDFIAGVPYDSVQCVGGDNLAVISKNIASRYWGSAPDALGNEIYVNRVPRRIVGIVDDVSPLASEAHADVWVPAKTSYAPNSQRSGGMRVAIVMEPGIDLATMRDRVEQRLATINSSIVDEGVEVSIMGGPLSQEEMMIGSEWGEMPDVEGYHKKLLIIFIILLIVPAVNLAGMTQSRLRRRTSEIGVRRAFGATRSSILMDLFVENFIITLAAGLMGLVLSLLFAYYFGPLVFAENSNMTSDSVVSLGALFHWSTFGLVLLFCFVLNIISTGIPALRASRVNPVNALNGNQK